MDGRLARQQLLFFLPLFMFMAPCLAFEEYSSRRSSNLNALPAPSARLISTIAPAPPLAAVNTQPPVSVPAVALSTINPAALNLSSLNLTGLTLLSFTPQNIITNNIDLFALLPKRYQVHVELIPSGPVHEGNQRLNIYPSFQLTSQSSLGFSFNKFRPRFNIERAGLQTSLHFRGDGIKLNFRPTAISTQLEFDVKITDDESRLDLTYRY